MQSTKNNIEKNFKEISDKLILLYKNDENKIDINFYDKKIKQLINKFNIENREINNFVLSENTILLIAYADNIYFKDKKQTLNTLENFYNIFLIAYIYYLFSHLVVMEVFQLKIIIRLKKVLVLGKI